MRSGLQSSLVNALRKAIGTPFGEDFRTNFTVICELHGQRIRIKDQRLALFFRCCMRLRRNGTNALQLLFSLDDER
jgi:hypothetical protein